MFVVLIAFGLVLRILLYHTGWMGLDSDEAAGDLMVLRASQGHLSLLFWGANYGGASITWVEALLVEIFGFHLLVMWVVDTLVALGCSLALWSVSKRLVSPVAAAVAGGVFFFFPPLWIFWSSREYVFWAPAILFSLLCAKFVLDWFDSGRDRDAVAAGLFGGLAIWTYPLVAGLVIPPAVALVVASVKRHRIGTLVRAALAAVVGVAPWLAYFALHGSGAFTVQKDPQSKLSALEQSVGSVLPMAVIGGQQRSGLIWLMDGRGHSELMAVGYMAVGVSLVCLIGFLVARRWGLACCAAAALLWPLVLTAGHVPLSEATFRYGFIAIPPLLVEAAFILSSIRVVLVMALAAAAFSTYMADVDTSGFASAQACLPSLDDLASHLEAQGHTRVWAVYWMAGDLTVCAQPKLVAASTTLSRDPTARREVTASSPSVYVAFNDQGTDQQIGAYVAAHPGVATREIVDGYAVWYFRGRVEPAQMGLDGAF